jgi:YD repeat-containing protein
MLSDMVNNYTYDHANHLAAVSGSSSAAEYSYNGLGDRVSQTVDGNPRTTLSISPLG